LSTTAQRDERVPIFQEQAQAPKCTSLHTLDHAYLENRLDRGYNVVGRIGEGQTAVTLMVLRGALGVVCIGGVVGFAAAFALARFIRHILFGVAPWDLMTMLGVPLVLCAVAAVAALIPARRASRVNPVEALKYE